MSADFDTSVLHFSLYSSVTICLYLHSVLQNALSLQIQVNKILMLALISLSNKKGTRKA